MKPQENKTELRPETTRLLILALIALLGLAPLLLYWFRLGSAPQITPARARELLLEQNDDVRLIDVRPTEVGRRRSIDGSSHWGGTDILEITDADEVPGHLQDTTLLLICDNGILGAKATKHLRRLGVDNAFNVRGGIQDWIGTADSLEGAEFGRFITPTGGSEFPFRHSPLFEQLAMVICAFAIKPAYVLLSFILIVILRKSGSVDLVALRWGMIFFFLGENFCTLNYYLFNETSYLFEYLHSFGMLLSLSLYKRYKEEGKAFAPVMIRILSHGGSMKPAEILSEAGVDIIQHIHLQDILPLQPQPRSSAL